MLRSSELGQRTPVSQDSIKHVVKIFNVCFLESIAG